MADERQLRDYLKKAIAETREVRRRLTEAENKFSEPIAVIGIGCRFPGEVASADDLWRVAAEGRDTIGPFPTDRGWNLANLFDTDPDTPGTSYARDGGFLDDVAGFDAEFFGISPREAAAMDPQQRLLLESAWHALEDAGIDPDSLRGSPTGVFAGVAGQDYASLAMASDGTAGHAITGNVGSVVSGRVAYSLGLEGPAVTLDTACSSSLVAIHLAAQSLRTGESTLVLAGGVTVMSTPAVFVEFSKQRGLAADGRCKAFSDGADGMGPSEGVGLVVLERLSDARRNGRRILAVLRGSAVNQDGASNGLSAPNGVAQQRVIRAALDHAGLTVHDIDAVEAHGTGTALGDPIEAQALLATYGAGRDPQHPLLLGSVKSNIGHTQAAAGVAGVIKMIQAMRHGTVPRTLHADRPTTHVDWQAGAVALVNQQALPWPETGRPRRAAVSSFGISGTNAHVVLEQSPAAEPAPQTASDRAPAGEVVPWVLSAASPAALADVAKRLRPLAEQGTAPDTNSAHDGTSEPVRLGAIASALWRTRAHLPHRAVILGRDRDDFTAGLDALATRTPADHVVTGQAAPERGGTVFVFPGQGSQWPGMGSELLDTVPAFAQAVADCDDALTPHTGWSVTDVLRQTPNAPSLERVDVVQPTLFTMMVALARTWQAHNIHPDAVIGHSQGEIAAAHIAGALTLDDATRLIAQRAAALPQLAGHGTMASITLPPDTLTPLLPPGTHIAAHNSPTTTVVAGDTHAIHTLLAHCHQHHIHARQIPVDYASHTHHVETLKTTLLDIHLTPQQATIPFYSTVTATHITDTTTLTPTYWYNNLRNPVLFHPTLTTLNNHHHTHYIETSPHPILTTPIQQTHPHHTTTPTLHRNKPQHTQLLNALTHTHTTGHPTNLTPHIPHTTHHTPLPTYPFQHQHHWLTPNHHTTTPTGQTTTHHPLLTAKIDLPNGTTLHTGEINPHTHPWTTQHTVNNTPLLPGTALVDLVWHVAGAAGMGAVDELALHAPVVVPAEQPAPLRVSMAPEDAQGVREITVHSLDEDGSWVHHATAMLRSEPAPPAESLTTWPPPGAEPIDVDGLYTQLADDGLYYGPMFQNVQAAWRDDRHTYAELALPDGTEADGHELHPALLDAALHPLALGRPGEEREPTMPFAFTGITLHAREATRLRVRLTLHGPETLSVLAADTNGAPVAAIEELRLRAVPDAAAQLPRNALFRLAWRPLGETPADARPDAARYAVVGDDGLVDALNGAGAAAQAWPDLAAAEPGDADGPTAVLLRYPAPAEPGALGDAVLTAVQRHAATLRDWLDDEDNADIPLVVATTGAVTTEPDAPLDLVHAPLWGLTRSAQAEYPGRVILLDLDPAAPHSADLAGLLAAALASGEPQLALRGGELLTARLTPLPLPASSPEVVDPERTVLITGANGGVAHHVAEHLLLEYGVKNLLLLSRTRPDALAEHLTALGGRPIALACDVTSRSEVAAALAAIPAEHPLQSVVHTAAVLDDATLHGLTAPQLARVLGPKVHGTLVLNELTRELDLTSFVLYSSASATFGGAGQAAYTAANGFLDAFAQNRRVAGEPVTSVGWGLWDTGTGMAATLAETDLRRVRRGGIVAMTPAQALGLHDRAPDAGPAHLIASPVRTSALRREEAHPLLLDLVRGGGATRLRSAANTEEASELVIRLRRQNPSERQETLLALVTEQANAALGHPSGHAIDAGQPFRDLGFDSLTAVELRNRLHAATGLRLPATLVFDHPRPDALAAHLGTLLLGDSGAAPDTSAAPAAAADADEPIAIIGLACRFPGGVEGPEDLWRMLVEGRDGIGDFPTDRGWDLEALFDEAPERTGTSYARQGGFLDNAAGFDAAFFGISPREALAMDPQQRLLLETTWHTVEHAGIDPTTLRSTPTGVFTGISNQDYTRLAADLPPEVEGYLGTGNAGSVLSGRLAYVLGLEGPALTVDTACSSSLVALHLAAQSLRSGESTLALAGGVTVMATPSVFIEFSRQRGLAPDGRSKAFSARADGMGPAEGVGMLLLEKLSDARRNNRRIHAVIRGSAVNQDGASNGLSAPSGAAQQRVIRSALAGAGLTAGDIDAVEAHGTGTALGDPIEAQALLETYGAERTAPLYLGSVKSNIGHTQAAAGAAGVLKMVLAMRHGVVPATLHADEPTPHVDWSGPVVLAGDNTPWPETGRPRRAAVSSFGISGTNAHLILEQAPEVPTVEAAPDTGPPVPVLLSARTPQALRHQARRLHDRLAEPDAPSLGRAAQVLATGRTAFPHRLALVAGPHEDPRAALAAAAAGQPSAESATGVTREGQTGFLFTGQGAQRAAGAELYARFPVFTKALDEVCAALDQHLEGPARDLVLNPAQEDLGRTELMQPAVFALQVALAELLADEYGVRPQAVLGHSVGEVAAAHVAGVLDLADAAALITARGRLMARLPADGAMIAIAAPESEVLAAIEGRERDVAVAAVNGPRATVLSGTASEVERIAERFAARKVRTRRLRVGRAFHSPQLDDLLAEFGEVAAGVSFASPRLSLVSDVTGRVVDDEVCTAEYWVRQARQPVRFADGVGELLALGVTRFLELGPDAVLTPLARDLVPAGHVVRPVLRRERDEAATLTRALAELWSSGAAVRWQGLLPDGGAPAELPGYGFDRARYWLGGGFRAAVGQAAPAPVAGEDLLALPPAERAAKAADLVRRTAASVLGHADASALAPDVRLTDLGMDSLAALELRGRLDAAARIRLETTAVFDFPTLDALTAHVVELLDHPQETAVTGGLGALYWSACADGRLTEAGDLLRAAARLRPAFTATAPAAPASPVSLADGDAAVPVLCLPSFSTVAGPHEFAGFAAALPGAREVWALPEPGFGPGEAIPADLAALVAVQAAAARDAARGRPCVLVGRSASGLLVNSLAAALEASGDPVRAVVLLDVYPPSLTRAQAWVERELTQAVAERENLPALYNDARLITMGRYFEAFADWEPTPTGAPTLHVRAREPFAAHLADPEREYGDWRSAWDLPHDAVDVPGDHFSILDTCAASTAAAVAEWLDDRPEED